MPVTYESIATTSVTSATNTITFSSIPSTYTDLRIVMSVIGATNSGQDIYVRFNSDSATNYSYVTLVGTGTVSASGRLNTTSTLYINSQGTSLTIPHSYLIDIFSYAGSANKTLLVQSMENENGPGYARVSVGAWRSTSAINTISFTTNQFGVGTIATLYGILKA